MKPDLNQLMQEAQKMQERMKKAQEELENLTVTGEAGGGLAKVQMTGRHDVKKVIIDEDLLDDDKNMIEDIIAAAVNDAVRKVEQETRGKMSQLTSGINLPTDAQG